MLTEKNNVKRFATCAVNDVSEALPNASRIVLRGQHGCRIHTFARSRKGRAPPATAPACCPDPTGASRKLPPHPRSRGAARSPAHANNSARQKDGACSTESLIVSPVACSGNGFGVVGSLGVLRRRAAAERSLS